MLLLIADILRGVRDDMCNGELGGGNSLHQVFVLSQVRRNPRDVRQHKFHRRRSASSACELIYFSKFLFLLPSSLTMTYNDNYSQITLPYDAPFFTTWFCTNWEVLYFPVYFICRATRTKCATPSEIIVESLRGFRDKGFTGGRFLLRCSLFCCLWVITNYLYILSLRILLATDVMALFATNVSCVYLLSWVILHEQFVGVRVSIFKKTFLSI